MWDHPPEQRCCRQLQLSREPDSVSLGMGQKRQCLFVRELGGVFKLTLEFLSSCVLAQMMCSTDPCSAGNHEGANQLSPHPRLFVLLGFFLAKLCCPCQE